MTNIDETIKDIKTQCRLAMNGAVSAAMRERGIVYKLNFGVEYPRIKAIARQYEPDHDLASALWKSGIRELQIMAGLMQPVETMLPGIASIWIDDITNCELAEMTSMNLFCRLPYAPVEALRWVAADDEMRQYCGYLTITRLLGRGTQYNERAVHELIDQAISAALGEAVWPRQGAVGVLKELAAQSPEQSRAVMSAVNAYAAHGKPLWEELRTQLRYAAAQ